MSDFADLSLPEVAHDAWLRLVNGAVKPKDPLAYAYLASHAPFGISQRTVVLRRALPDVQTLLFHTDRRSGKYGELAADPRVSLLFYDDRAKIQLRLAAVATLHPTGPLADAEWQRIGPGSRKVYCATEQPGQLADAPRSGLPPDFETDDLTLAQSETGREHFAVVHCRVTFMDWLRLTRDRHYRAQFRYPSDGPPDATWVIP